MRVTFNLKARGTNLGNAQYLANMLAVEVAQPNKVGFTCGWCVDKIHPLSNITSDWMWSKNSGDVINFIDPPDATSSSIAFHVALMSFLTSTISPSMFVHSGGYLSAKDTN